MTDLIAKVIEKVKMYRTYSIIFPFSAHQAIFEMRISFPCPIRHPRPLLFSADISITARHTYSTVTSYDLPNVEISEKILDDLISRHLLDFGFLHDEFDIIGTPWALHDLIWNHPTDFRILNDGLASIYFRQFLDPTPYIFSLSPAPSRSQSQPQPQWEPAPSYMYQPPPVTRSALKSDIKTGHSYPFKTDNFIGSGSHVKVRNGVRNAELENTANSGSQKDPLAYLHTSKVDDNGTRINTGRDPTGLIAPLSSLRKVGGQLHPFLGDPQNPQARYQYGGSNLRKITKEQQNAAVRAEIIKRRAEKAAEAAKAKDEAKKRLLSLADNIRSKRQKK